MSDINYLKHYNQAFNGIDVEKNQQIFIDSGNVARIFHFVVDIPKANFAELQKAFIKANTKFISPYYIEHFANHFKDKADIEALRDVLIKFGKQENIDSFNKKFPKKRIHY